MYQTKIGSFFKKIPAPNANSPTKSDPVEKPKLEVSNGNSKDKTPKSKVTPSPVKSAFDKLIVEKNGDAAKPKPKSTYGSKKSKNSITKECRVVLTRTPSPESNDEEMDNPKKTSPVEKSKPQPTSKSGMKRKSKADSAEEDEPADEPKQKSSKKPRRRIVVDSSSSGSDNASESESEATAKVEKPVETPQKAKPKDPKIDQKKQKKESKSKSPPISSKKSPKSTTVAKPKSPKEDIKESESKTVEKTEIDNKPIKDEEVKKSSLFTVSPKKNTIASNQLKSWNPEYFPTKPSNKYDPIEDATWERGQKVPYLALAKTLEAIEETSSRLKIIETLANYFRSVIALSPDDLLFSLYLCLNKLAPAYEGVELGIAETNIMKAIAQATGRSLQHVKADAATKGDLGLVAESSRSNQSTLIKPLPLSVNQVFHKLKEIAGMTGHAVQQKKIGMIQQMLVSCKYSEARYLTRSLAGKLRIGLAEQSLLQALSQACYLTPPNQDASVWPPKIIYAGNKMSPETLKSKIEEQAFILKSSYCECPSYEILVDALVKEGFEGLHKYCKLTPGIPPRPMLAQPTKGVADVLQRFDGIKFTSEFKYDGERAQIHLLEDGTVNIFSRNQENNTSKYPDIISRFGAWNKGNVKSCILDTEAVAWDQEKECILPFQVLSTRKRKDANEAEIKVQVFIFAFDLIYLNGTTLIKEPLVKRRELLRENFGEVHGEFGFATSIDTDSMEEVQEFLEESIKGNCEGLMVKTLHVNASYELAKRSQKWLKLKKDYMDSGGDSLDLVVIGGFLGKGKRTGTYGGFLLACYDPDNEEFQSICKLGTGFSDEQLVQHSESLKPHIIKAAKPYYRCNSQLTPDHWFDAVQVWEVKCADLSLSPVHTAGAGLIDPQRGISLRFPRFLKIRDDKNIEDATSSSQVADMYKNQEVVKNSDTKKGADEDEDDFY